MPVSVADVKLLAEADESLSKSQRMDLVLYASRNPGLLEALAESEALEYLQDGLQQETLRLATTSGAVAGPEETSHPLERHFQAGGAVHPTSNFWVDPEILSKVVNALLQGSLMMIIGARQFGKSSLAQRLRGMVTGKRVTVPWREEYPVKLAVLPVCLTSNIPMDPAGFITFLHYRLHASDPKSIPAPDSLPAVGMRPEIALEIARTSLLEALRPRVDDPRACAYAIIIDEAGFLAGQHIKKEKRDVAARAVSAFLSILKDDVRDNRAECAVHCVALLGVDSLRRMLHDVNTSRVVEDEPADQASPMEVEGSEGSDSSAKWRNLSPFSEDLLYELVEFTVDQIEDLLRQYADQKERVLGDQTEKLPCRELAEIIFERTRGFPALVGLCCSEIATWEVVKVEDWYQWCGADLAGRVQMRRNFSVISSTIALLVETHSWVRLRELLADLLLYNHCEADRAERRTIVEILLSDGIARISSQTDDKITLQVRSPLLRDVLLAEARFGLTSCPQPPNAAELDMGWVLREAIRRINTDNITAAAARTKSKAFSEYIWHGELWPLVKAIIYKAYPTLIYRVVTEGRDLNGAHPQKRIDLVVTSNGRLPAHGVEALTCGSIAEVEEHYLRARDVYQPLYTKKSKTPNGHDIESTIQVVNICYEGEAQRGLEGYGWQPQDASAHVEMVHVKVLEGYKRAIVMWSDGTPELLDIHAGHGTLEFHDPLEL